MSRQLRGAIPVGRSNTVELPVSTSAALLVVKGFALGGGDKTKDSCDIRYSVPNYPGGPSQLGEDCEALL